eukprot:TRINITY_DN2603_c0_g1_i1.p2 TRINITY_DN2603_c0_g1~~TRINITY_DN2603_c0_g1_i1.p2  ORF type:complete len:476 (+),score=78.20 TRINITY_DN2603_c0_g1_i1:45-1472(+)
MNPWQEYFGHYQETADKHGRQKSRAVSEEILQFFEDVSIHAKEVWRVWDSDCSEQDKRYRLQSFNKWFKLNELRLASHPFEMTMTGTWRPLCCSITMLLRVLQLSLIDNSSSDPLIYFNNTHLYRVVACLMIKMVACRDEDLCRDAHEMHQMINFGMAMGKKPYELRIPSVSSADHIVLTEGIKLVGSDAWYIETIRNAPGNLLRYPLGWIEFFASPEKVSENNFTTPNMLLDAARYNSIVLELEQSVLANKILEDDDVQKMVDCIQVQQCRVIETGRGSHALLWISALAEMLTFTRIVVDEPENEAGQVPSTDSVDGVLYQKIPPHHDSTGVVAFPEKIKTTIRDCLSDLIAKSIMFDPLRNVHCWHIADRALLVYHEVPALGKPPREVRSDYLVAQQMYEVMRELHGSYFGLSLKTQEQQYKEKLIGLLDEPHTQERIQGCVKELKGTRAIVGATLLLAESSYRNTMKKHRSS